MVGNKGFGQSSGNTENVVRNRAADTIGRGEGLGGEERPFCVLCCASMSCTVWLTRVYLYTKVRRRQ